MNEIINKIVTEFRYRVKVKIKKSGLEDFIIFSRYSFGNVDKGDIEEIVNSYENIEYISHTIYEKNMYKCEMDINRFFWESEKFDVIK